MPETPSTRYTKASSTAAKKIAGRRTNGSIEKANVEIVQLMNGLDSDQSQKILRLFYNVSGYSDAQEASRVFLKEILDMLCPGGTGSILMKLPDKNSMMLYASCGLNVSSNEIEIPLDPHTFFGYEVLEDFMPRIYSQAELTKYFTPDLLSHYFGNAPHQILIAPVQFESETVGLINLECYDLERPFLPKDIQMIGLLAQYATNFLRSARLLERSRRREEEITSLYRVLKTVNSSLELDTILRSIQRALGTLFHFDMLSVMMLDTEKQVLHTQNALGERITPELIATYRRLDLPLEGTKSVILKVIRSRNSLLISKIDPEAEMLPYDRAVYEVLPYTSFLSVPLIVHKEVIGLMNFGSQYQELYLTKTELDAIEQYVGLVASGINNIRVLAASRKTQLELIRKNQAIQAQSDQIVKQNEVLAIQHDHLQQQSRELESIVKMMHIINQEMDLNKILEMIIEEGMVLMPGAEFGGFMVFDSKDKHFKYIATSKSNHYGVERLSYTWAEAMSRFTKETDRILQGVYIMYPEMDYSAPLEQIKGFPVSKATLALTVTIKGAVVGFMIFDNYTRSDAFSEYDMQKLRRFQDYAENAFFKARFIEKIQKQKDELSGAYAKISDSISYARRILEAILPRKKDILEAFPESFIFFRPKDIVSGDFYWFSKRNEELVIAAVDCTGHGVPGAFMSVLGNTLLNHVVNEKGLTDPGKILYELNQRVKNMLGQFDSDSESFEGMDVALCSFNPQTQKLCFAGANRPMYFLRDGKLTEIKGKPQPVGGNQHKVAINFETHQFQLKEGDRVYISTDGYADQFGGSSKNRKFLGSRLKDLLIQLSDVPMAMQTEALESALDGWRGRKPQLDDVLVIGIQVVTEPQQGSKQV